MGMTSARPGLEPGEPIPAIPKNRGEADGGGVGNGRQAGPG